ncbi:D-alanyl-D-alanine endopeptidase (penicillin-binding protein 7) [Pseudoduganella flava]|uniref:D-alanyl-D-alanine endopeptidase (Penicillin-binding protein 7) n=1 Tax=Pseudoduganella flava TaxID=871742 RepID=A0A562PSI3_9BURK|nr:serine hydrolase [Pseudoduganella flava]QGZ39323.1 peptidase S11 [Pseudoduganella flava]TWI47369.1 D-alanyl-D-alanine endopeptidase (penicillin-binding protein 7) [Pseudoduganella flava]
MYKVIVAALLSALCVSVPVTAVQAAEGVKKTAKKSVVKKAGVRRLAAAEPRDKIVRRVVTVRGKKKVVYQRMTNVGFAPRPTMGDLAGLNLTRDPLDLKSNVALVVDQNNAEVLFEKNANVALPIASITKMMTALVVVEANQDLDEVLTVTEDDVDRAKFSSSRLNVGDQLTRRNMLHIALMSSENRAASALGRNYPGGLPAFVEAMNAKAQALGMTETHYADSTGLSTRNVASARDLAKLAMAAYEHPMLREFSTDPKAIVERNGRPVQFGTTNGLVMPTSGWQIGLQKTGFINEAGRCMMMQAVVEGRAVIMVLLDAKGTAARVADAVRMKKWLAALKPASFSDTAGAAGAGAMTQSAAGM